MGNYMRCSLVAFVLCYFRTQACAQSPSLKLDASVIKARYCAADETGATLSLTVALKYTNTGIEPLLIWNRSNEAFQILVSQTVSDAKDSHNEAKFSVHQIEGDWQPPGDIPGADFPILQPRAELRLKGAVSIFFRRPGARRGGPLIKPGKHVVQVRIRTWPETIDRAGEYGKRWKSFGRLWYEPVLSPPATFTMDAYPWLVNCDGPSR